MRGRGGAAQKGTGEHSSRASSAGGGADARARFVGGGKAADALSDIAEFFTRVKKMKRSSAGDSEDPL